MLMLNKFTIVNEMKSLWERDRTMLMLNDEAKTLLRNHIMRETVQC